MSQTSKCMIAEKSVDIDTLSLGTVPPPNNYRDLGGVVTSRGPLLAGKIGRAALHDRPTLAGGLVSGCHHIIDLRRAQEISGLGSDEHIWHQRPLCDPQWGAKDGSTRFYVESGVRMMSAARATVGDALHLLAGGGSVLIGCRIGKDRTGVVVLLLGRLLGIADDALITDYVATGASFSMRDDWIRCYAAVAGEDPATVLARLSPSPAIPREILQQMPRTPEQLRSELGVPSALVERALNMICCRPALRAIRSERTSA